MTRYEYRGYVITNKGYHQPDHCVWWEAVDKETGESSFHGHTLREVEMLINDYEWEEKIRKLRNEKELLTEAIKPILDCKWSQLAGEHGTEYGDDKQFDALIDLVQNAQRKFKKLNIG